MPKVKTGENIKLSHVVSVLLTKDQYQAIRRRARQEGRFLSGHLRWLGMQDARAHGIEVADADDDVDTEDEHTGGEGEAWTTASREA